MVGLQQILKSIAAGATLVNKGKFKIAGMQTEVA
jgi:hypothetical protein